METSKHATAAIRAVADLLRGIDETQPLGLDLWDLKFVLDGVCFEARTLFVNERSARQAMRRASEQRSKGEDA